MGRASWVKGSEGRRWGERGEMGEVGSDVGTVLSLERREVSNEERVAPMPLEELLLWSCCSTAGRRSEEGPWDPRSATVLDTGEESC